jgi:hypothetical protein
LVLWEDFSFSEQEMLVQCVGAKQQHLVIGTASYVVGGKTFPTLRPANEAKVCGFNTPRLLTAE